MDENKMNLKIIIIIIISLKCLRVFVFYFGWTYFFYSSTDIPNNWNADMGTMKLNIEGYY